jgi:hypothetical protein
LMFCRTNSDLQEEDTHHKATYLDEEWTRGRRCPWVSEDHLAQATASVCSLVSLDAHLGVAVLSSLPLLPPVSTFWGKDMSSTCLPGIWHRHRGKLSSIYTDASFTG